jgi:glycosyltransferase involved in cell wall biosynthesis
MRILFLLYEYDRRVRGGMGGFRHALELAEQWTRMGHQVTILRPRLRRAEEPTPVPVVEIPIIDLPIVRPLIVYALLFAAGVLRSVRGRPDVVYSREMFAPTPLLLARLFGCPVLLEVNGDSYRHRSAFEPRWRLALLRWIQRVNFKMCDRVIAVTEGLREALLTRFALPPEKVVVIENGTNIERLKPLDPAACRRRLGLPEQSRYVGFAGTFFRYQGVQTLIEAAPLILEKRPEARFLIVGDGEMRKEWEARVRRLGIEAVFDFPGQIPYDAIPYYLGAMDLCVAPFTADRGEGSPLKLFDYMASGRPVIVSEIPAVKSLIERSRALAPVPPDDPNALAQAVLRILGDEKERRRLGEEGRAFVVREQSWEAVARRVLDAIASVKRGAG